MVGGGLFLALVPRARACVYVSVCQLCARSPAKQTNVRLNEQKWKWHKYDMTNGGQSSLCAHIQAERREPGELGGKRNCLICTSNIKCIFCNTVFAFTFHFVCAWRALSPSWSLERAHSFCYKRTYSISRLTHQQPSGNNE